MPLFLLPLDLSPSVLVRPYLTLSCNSHAGTITSDFCRSLFLTQKKEKKQKTHKRFSDGPCGTIVPGTNPHSSQGQTGQNSAFTVELNRKRPVCPRDGSQFVPVGVPFVPGRVPVCPGHRPAQNVYVYWFFLPD